MKIAIIGGIGSGKSEVLKVAKQKGAFCASADEINALLLRTPEYVEKLAKAFPDVVCDGIVDKQKLASAVFSDKSKRELLDSIAHPEIMRRIYDCDKDPYVVEIPLILKSGAIDYFDEIVLVSTPLLTRLKRLKGRGMSIRQALSRMRTQPSERKLKKIATVTIDNSGSKEELYVTANAVFDALFAQDRKQRG